MSICYRTTDCIVSIKWKKTAKYGPFTIPIQNDAYLYGIIRCERDVTNRRSSCTLSLSIPALSFHIVIVISFCYSLHVYIYRFTLRFSQSAYRVLQNKDTNDVSSDSLSPPLFFLGSRSTTIRSTTRCYTDRRRCRFDQPGKKKYLKQRFAVLLSIVIAKTNYGGAYRRCILFSNRR